MCTHGGRENKTPEARKANAQRLRREAERVEKRASYERDQAADGSLRVCKGKTGHRPRAMLDRSLFEYGAKQCKRCFDARRRKGSRFSRFHSRLMVSL
jgi:hypothetical protein